MRHSSSSETNLFVLVWGAGGGGRAGLGFAVQGFQVELGSWV